MKNLGQYSYISINAFLKFLRNEIGKDLLIIELKKCENHYRDINNISISDPRKLWFRFGKHDTIVTTIKDIERDLSLPTNHNNYKFMIEKFEIVTSDTNPNNEIRIYFS